jgi:hypothetical protein
LEFGHLYKLSFVPVTLNDVCPSLHKGALSMLLIIVPFAIVHTFAIGLDEPSPSMLAIFSPVALVNGAIQVVEATESVKSTSTESTFESADTRKEHQTLPFEVAIKEVPFIVIPIFKVKESMTPELIIFPLALIGVSIPVIHGSIALLDSLVKETLEAIPIAGNENSFTMYFIGFPLAIVH